MASASSSSSPSLFVAVVLPVRGAGASRRPRALRVGRANACGVYHRYNEAMRLLLIRHGKAEDASLWPSDSARPLAPEGRQQAERLAARLVSLGLVGNILLTSPIRRARETAELLWQKGAGPEPENWDALATGPEIAAVLPTLAGLRERGTRRAVLVGHMPTLADWAEELVWGQPCGRLVLKPAGVIGLELPDSGSLVGRSDLFWLTSPKLLP